MEDWVARDRKHADAAVDLETGLVTESTGRKFETVVIGSKSFHIRCLKIAGNVRRYEGKAGLSERLAFSIESGQWECTTGPHLPTCRGGGNLPSHAVRDALSRVREIREHADRQIKSLENILEQLSQPPDENPEEV